MKKNYTDQNNYSVLIAYISLYFSFYSFLKLYLNSSLLWLLVGTSLVFNFLSIRYNSYRVYHIFKSRINNSYLSKIFLYFNSIVLFFSSTYGLYKFVSDHSFLDKGYLYLPYHILCLLFLGSSIGLYYPNNYK